jgi:hypothetical protein
LIERSENPDLPWVLLPNSLNPANAPHQCLNRETLQTLAKWTTYGHRWAGGTHQGRMPLLNADQIIELKEWVKEDQAIGRQNIVQTAMVIRHCGREDASGWLKALGDAQMAATVHETVLGDDTRAKSWVNWMVGKLQLALQMGETLEAQQERWGTTGTVRERFADKASAVAGVRDELR